MTKSSLVSFAQDLIQCPSITPDASKALDLVEQKLKTLGLETQRLTYGEGDEAVDNLFAFYGTGKPHFCFLGHVDVVPYGPLENWTFPPTAGHIENGILYGRGAVDMKSSVAAFCDAVAAFINSHNDFGGKVSLLITGDEEGPAINGTKKVIDWMTKNNHMPDICLVGEPGCRQNFGDTIKIGRRGSLSGTVKIIGKQGHAAYPHLAENPVPALLDIAKALNEFHYDDGNEWFEPTNLEVVALKTSSDAYNVIPASAELRFNVRFNTTYSTESLKTCLEKIIHSKTTLKTEVTFITSGESFLSSASMDLLNQFANIIETHTNIRPDFTTNGGTSDARFMFPYCPILEFGPLGKTIHQINEHIHCDELEKLAEIYHHMLRFSFNPGSLHVKKQENT